MADQSLSSSELKNLLNPYWHHAYAEHDSHKVTLINAKQLLKPERFDLAAKTLLARTLREGKDTTWAKNVYREHLAKWSGGDFVETDGSGKSGFETYYQTFEALFQQMSREGFNTKMSVLPVSEDIIIHDGAHRAGIAIDLGLTVPIATSQIKASVYDYRFFQGCGLRDTYLDAMALEYCERTEDSYIAYLFPVEGRDDDQAIAYLQEVGSIYYDRPLELTRRGIHNLVAQIYRGEHWLGTASNGFAGAESHVKNRYLPGQDVRCIFFQADSLEEVVEAKTRIRGIYNQGNYPVHINDTHEEIVHVGRQILNTNGRHFMNHGQPGRYPKAHQRLEQFREHLQANNLDPHDYMIDSSFVMALYGLRGANDLDYLHTDEPLDGLPEDFQSHNEELDNYNYGLGRMLTDPQHYFFYEGVKIASLALVSAMKEKRGEVKDVRDIELIRGLHQPESWHRQLSIEMQYFIRTLPHRFNKMRLRMFLMIPTSIQPIAKNFYRSLFKR